MNYYRCQANSITFHFLTVTRKVNFLKVLVSMFLFPTTAHRAVVMVFLSAVRLYYKEVASSPTYSLISILFTKAHRWLLDFLMLLFKSIDSYPIRKDGNQRARSCKLFTCKIHANYIICILTFLAYNVIIIMLNK